MAGFSSGIVPLTLYSSSRAQQADEDLKEDSMAAIQTEVQAPSAVITLAPGKAIKLPDKVDLSTVPSKPELIRNEIKELSKKISAKYTRLAQLLAVVRDKRYYERWGYESFEQYIREETGMHIETARTWVRIETEVIGKAAIPRETVAEIGWTKTKALLPAASKGLITATNKKEIIEKAKTLSTTELRSYVHHDLLKDTGPGLTSVTFFFTAEQLETITQARELAGQLINSTDPGVQLAAIAQDYLSSITEHDTKAPDMFRLRRLQTIVDVLDKAYGLRVILEGKTPHGTALLKAFQKTDTKRPVL
jgi:hypothetical protein